jgi:hypothetical protein
VLPVTRVAALLPALWDQPEAGAAVASDQHRFERSALAAGEPSAPPEVRLPAAADANLKSIRPC